MLSVRGLLICTGAITALALTIGRLSPPPDLRAGWGGQGQDAADTAHYSQHLSGEANNARIEIDAEFLNFNNDDLKISFALPVAAVRASTDEYGYRQSEVDELVGKCQASQCSQSDLDARVSAFYQSRGLEAQSVNGHTRLFSDILNMAKRNKPRVQPLALALDTLGKSRSYDSDAQIGAAAAFVQTSLRYENVPMESDGLQTLGVWTPPYTLKKGAGDCDTKSALLMSVLANWSGIRMIGIHVPKHYLMGVARVPRKDEAYLDYGGESYVLIEPAGPGWLPPGSISDYSHSVLETMEGVRVDPLK